MSMVVSKNFGFTGRPCTTLSSSPYRDPQPRAAPNTRPDALGCTRAIVEGTAYTTLQHSQHITREKIVSAPLNVHASRRKTR